MSYVDPTGQSYSLTPSSGVGSTTAASTNLIGNLYAIGVGQSIAIIPEATEPRLVWIFNVGLLPVILSTLQISVTPSTPQQTFPPGLHIPCGDMFELKTALTVYAAVPLTPRYFSSQTALIQPKALVSTGAER